MSNEQEKAYHAINNVTLLFIVWSFPLELECQLFLVISIVKGLHIFGPKFFSLGSHIHTTYSCVPKDTKLLMWSHGTEIRALNEYTNFLHFHSHTNGYYQDV